MSEMIERVAKAICEDEWGPESFDILTPAEQARYGSHARAAIAAMREINPVIRDENGRRAFQEIHGAPADVWRLLIDAALSEHPSDPAAPAE